MTISNNQVLRLKKMLVNGKNQSVYQPKIYKPRELPQFLVDENEEYIEVVNPAAVVEKNPNAVSLQGEGVEVKTINTVMQKPEAPKPEAKTIEVKPPEEKVTVKRVRHKSTDAE
jgi:hypothetical protein